MAEPLTVIGFRHSVYTWIVHFALAEMGLSADYIETNPFADEPDAVLAKYTPFNRVPVLVHNGFRLTETAAILRYLNDVSGASLVPAYPKPAARMAQVMGIVDADVYPIMVRKVFSHGFYLPFAGHEADPDILQHGLQQARPALQMLNEIAGEGAQLSGATCSLADLHLAPMIAYFAHVPQAAALLETFPALATWWEVTERHPQLRITRPDFVD
jgi:glutathione S-transferase